MKNKKKYRNDDYDDDDGTWVYTNNNDNNKNSFLAFLSSQSFLQLFFSAFKIALLFQLQCFL